MEREINARMFIIGIISMLLTGTIVSATFYNVYSSQIKKDVKVTAEILAVSYENMNDRQEFEGYANDVYEITLISNDEQTLNNENQLSVANIVVGEAAKGEFGTYYYTLKISDGSILKVDMDSAAVSFNYNKIIVAIIAVGIIIVLMSMLFGKLLTKRLVSSIVNMAENLDTIDEDVPYKELESFVLAIKKQQYEKAETEKMRREFTANVSHELKTPLTSISGYAEMIANGMAKDDNDVKAFAERIYSETGRLIGLISDILNLSELNDPQAPKKIELVDIYEVAKNTKELLALKAKENGVEVSVIGESAFVDGNKTMIEELAYNLCDNAIRYNKKDGMVKMTVVPAGDKVVFCVLDNGIGIPKEHQERIFERFYRVDKSRSKETGGTGLGLAIVKHIAMQHGGQIKMESQKDEGTSMEIVLKRSEEEIN